MKKHLAEFGLYFIVFGFAAIIVQLVLGFADLQEELDEGDAAAQRTEKALWRKIAELQRWQVLREEHEKAVAAIEATDTTK